MPHSSACFALILSPDKNMPIARGTVIILGSNQVDPPSGTIPRLGTNTCIKLADSAANTTSHANAMELPYPAVTPLTAAMTGLPIS